MIVSGLAGRALEALGTAPDKITAAMQAIPATLGSGNARGACH